ncbi:MAG: hypothetical protein GDA54_03150 [Alphaproteobacteria bacterium GM7ARS4]|nr:hypothetical protein [Alphaproteobacteria bacterium GM7ARS4]
MSVKLNPLLRFDKGLEEVVRQQTQPSSLPRRGTLAPNHVSTRPMVEDVLFPPALHEDIAAYFSPVMEDSSILLPARYRDILQSLIEKMHEAGRLQPDYTALFERSAEFLTALKDDYLELVDRRQAHIHG